jgi:hypothetical protein
MGGSDVEYIARHISGEAGLTAWDNVDLIEGSVAVRGNTRGARHMRYAMVKMVN